MFLVRTFFDTMPVVNKIIKASFPFAQTIYFGHYSSFFVALVFFLLKKLNSSASVILFKQTSICFYTYQCEYLCNILRTQLHINKSVNWSTICFFCYFFDRLRVELQPPNLLDLWSLSITSHLFKDLVRVHMLAKTGRCIFQTI